MTTSNPNISRKVTLEEPIKRGEQEITELQVRKPGSGELRGLTFKALSELDIDTVIRLLPRVTVPPITEPEAAALEPCDQLALGGEVANFLLPKALRPDFPTE